MNTFEQLDQYTTPQIRALACQHKVTGWHYKRPVELIKELVQVSELENLDLLQGEPA
jgi:hypothetical protein